MSDLSLNQRQYPRLSTVGGDYQVRFRIGELQVTGARLANISAGGCGLEVQVADAADLAMGTTLTELFLVHPDLPLVPLQGSVVFMLGKAVGKTRGFVLAGVQFTRITPMVQLLIAEHVQEALTSV